MLCKTRWCLMAVFTGIVISLKCPWGNADSGHSLRYMVLWSSILVTLYFNRLKINYDPPGQCILFKYALILPPPHFPFFLLLMLPPHTSLVLGIKLRTAYLPGKYSHWLLPTAPLLPLRSSAHNRQALKISMELWMEICRTFACLKMSQFACCLIF